MSERASAPLGHKSGTLITTLYDDDRVVVSDTVKCCHCGRQWVWKPGSGKVRGYCMSCANFTCGRLECDPCRTEEQLLENMEAGRPYDYVPVRILVPGGVPPAA